ncbi:MAG: alkaline phosphatase family protein [Candidatus Bathyarchaeota archaeon]|nr:alkaline phosphatase family protein [Candidatus Bathyarchaeota archaeon]
MSDCKLILVGIDSMILDLVQRFVAEGAMPNIKELMHYGSYGYALPSMPTFTPPNWTTIATGADPSVHGITKWVFNSKECKAKHLWTKAAEHGLRSVLLRYPCGWPSTHKNVIVISDGAPHDAIGVIEEAKAYTMGKIYRYSGGLHGTFETSQLNFSQAESWKNLPESELAPMETEIDLITSNEYTQIRWVGLVYADGSRSYNRLLICKTRDIRDSVCNLRPGEWSNHIIIDLERNGEKKKAVFRFKLVELDENLKGLSIFRTQIHSLEGFTDPPEIGEEICRSIGPFLDNPSRFCLAHKWFGTYFEELKWHLKWLVEAAAYLKKEIKWNLLFTQCQAPDYVQHECWAGIDPSAPGHNPEKATEYWNILRETYMLMDKYIGDLRDLSEDDTLFLVVSDHGHLPNKGVIFLADALIDRGLLILDREGNVDTARSIVRGFTHDGIILNTQKRFKDGILSDKESEEYVEEVIDLLLSIMDGDRHVITLAVKGSEAYVLGLDESSGDVIFAPRPGYHLVTRPSEKLQMQRTGYIGLPDPKYGIWGGAQSIHNGIPSARSHLGTNLAMFVISGPGIKRGYYCTRPIWLRDLAPTLSYLMGLGRLENANGALINEILETKC